MARAIMTVARISDDESVFYQLAPHEPTAAYSDVEALRFYEPLRQVGKG